MKSKLFLRKGSDKKEEKVKVNVRFFIILYNIYILYIILLEIDFIFPFKRNQLYSSMKNKKCKMTGKMKGRILSTYNVWFFFLDKKNKLNLLKKLSETIFLSDFYR